jgi:hypothetical protein
MINDYILTYEFQRQLSTAERQLNTKLIQFQNNCDVPQIQGYS